MNIALILNDNFSMWNFRKGLIVKLIKLGHNVTLIVPPGEYTLTLERLGAKVIQLKMNRFFSFYSDIILFCKFIKIFKTSTCSNY